MAERFEIPEGALLLQQLQDLCYKLRDDEEKHPLDLADEMMNAVEDHFRRYNPCGSQSSSS